jgi:hypothetical protein
LLQAVAAVALNMAAVAAVAVGSALTLLLQLVQVLQ